MIAMSVALHCLFLSASAVGDEPADGRAIQAILHEIELVPSLYGNGGAGKPEALPKFSAKKLAAYVGADSNAADNERRAWLTFKDRYEKQHPLRAAIFAAEAEMQKVQNIKIYRTLPRAVATPKGKALVLKSQESLALSQFTMERVLQGFQTAAESRDRETSKRWQANYDFAYARVLANLVFLMEYNFTLGQIRADNLPELSQGDVGWALGFSPNARVTEAKAKVFVKDSKKLWEMIQRDHPATPWAYFSQRESQRSLGMQWTPSKE